MRRDHYALYSEGQIGPLRALTVEEIRAIVAAAVDVQAAGFDGVQLHAAHGGLLSAFLSPYTNRRLDAYGGPVENRVRIVREIVAGIRARGGDFPVLIKLNGTDYLPAASTPLASRRWRPRSPRPAWMRSRSAAGCGTAWCVPRQSLVSARCRRPNPTHACARRAARAIFCRKLRSWTWGCP